MVPAANYRNGRTICEAVHGTAPDITGKNNADPVAGILPGAILADHLGDNAAAVRIRRALGEVLRD